MNEQLCGNTLLYTGSFQPQFRTSMLVDADVEGSGDGMYVYRLDEADGTLRLVHNLYGVINPSRFCLDVRGRLYAASDTNEFLNWEAGTGGGVYALGLGPDGAPRELARRSSCGVRAVGLCCDPSGKYLVAINQGSEFCSTAFVKNGEGRYEARIRRDEGCAVLLRLGENGFERVCDRYVFPEGTPAHPHSMQMDDEGYLYVTNASAGVVSVLKLDGDAERLIPIASICAREARGLGSIALHPRLPVFYCSCEESGEIVAFGFDKAAASIKKLQSAAEEDRSSPGPLVLDAGGNTLYAADSVRGEMKAYAVSQEGRLVPRQRLALGTGGSTPGAFYDLAVSPSGKWLALSDMKGGRILTLRIGEDGFLSPGAVAQAPTPTGLLFRTLLKGGI